MSAAARPERASRELGAALAFESALSRKAASHIRHERDYSLTGELRKARKELHSIRAEKAMARYPGHAFGWEMEREEERDGWTTVHYPTFACELGGDMTGEVEPYSEYPAPIALGDRLIIEGRRFICACACWTVFARGDVEPVDYRALTAEQAAEIRAKKLQREFQRQERADWWLENQHYFADEVSGYGGGGDW